MRILMLSWEYPPRIVGGISRVVHDLAQQLGKKGNEIHVVTCWQEGSFEFEKDNNVYVHRVHTCDVNTNNFVDWVLQLNFSMLEHSIKLLNEIGKVDIIHAHDWIVCFAAKTLKCSYSIPMISTIHATEHGRNWGIHNEVQKYISSVEWWLTYESWKVIVNSRYMNEEVCKLFKLPGDKTTVVPNGVDTHKFEGFKRDYEFRRKFALDNEKIVFFIGRLVNEKGAQILVDAVPKVLNQYHDAKFIIAGKGPQFDYLRGKCMEMNISHKVYLTGYVSEKDLCRLYKCADVAVFPSLYEPFGIVALEAMVADIPVVVSDTGGLGDIVTHGVDGMKAYTGNSNSLADCILEILFNPEKAGEMRKNALKKVQTVYNWEVISEQTMKVYEEVVKERKAVQWNSSDIMGSFNGKTN